MLLLSSFTAGKLQRLQQQQEQDWQLLCSMPHWTTATCIRQLDGFLLLTHCLLCQPEPPETAHQGIMPLAHLCRKAGDGAVGQVEQPQLNQARA